jgi:5-(carboxyamino)imidazole ribonucleotide synthase
MKKIGILGGGQLALMMLPSIQKLGFHSVVLDQSGASTEKLADTFISGNFASKDDCLKLADCDVVTFEIENISLEGLKELSTKTMVHPSPAVLETIQNKGIQKQFLKSCDVPTSDFKVEKLTSSSKFQNKVVKLTTGGYDGKGVWIPKSDDIPAEFLNQDCVIEEKVSIAKELSVVCSRNTLGEIKTYEMVEMVMDPDLNLLDYQINPSSVALSIQDQARNHLITIVEKLNYVGTLACEFFLDTEGKLWVNELAPRVHNSGHNTIESAPTSQFENHIRAIAGLDLGETLPAKSSLTMNLIGTGSSGPTKIEGTDSLPENVFVHLYNKKESRPGRKMGHLTILGEGSELLKLKDEMKNLIQITGEPK